MALNQRLSVAAQNAAANAITALIGADGFLDIYDGAQPANPDTAVGAQVKLAHLAFSADAFGDAVAGVATANPITSDDALADGVATWARITKNDGTAVWDLSVGEAAANIIMNSTDIAAGATVAISDLTITVPVQGS